MNLVKKSKCNCKLCILLRQERDRLLILEIEKLRSKNTKDVLGLSATERVILGIKKLKPKSHAPKDSKNGAS